MRRLLLGLSLVALPLLADAGDLQQSPHQKWGTEPEQQTGFSFSYDIDSGKVTTKRTYKKKPDALDMMTDMQKDQGYKGKDKLPEFPVRYDKNIQGNSP